MEVNLEMTSANSVGIGSAVPPFLALHCSAAEVPDPEEILKSSNIDLAHAERLGSPGIAWDRLGCLGSGCHPSMAMAGKHRGLERNKYYIKNFNFMRNIMKFNKIHHEVFFLVLYFGLLPIWRQAWAKSAAATRQESPGFLVPSCTLWYSKNPLENHDVYILVIY